MLKNVFMAIAALGALAGPNAAASDEIAVIVHKDSDVTELSPEQLAAIFTMSRRQWNGGANITAFNYAPDNEIRNEFDRVVLHLSPNEVGRFWMDQRIRSGIHPPRQVNDPKLVLRLTARLTAAIGYVPAGIVSSSVKIVARIRDGKVLAPSRMQKTLGGEPGRSRPTSFRHAPTPERGLIQFAVYPGTATSLGVLLRERAPNVRRTTRVRSSSNSCEASTRHRQGDSERGPCSGTLDGDHTAVRLDDAFGDREAKADALAIGLPRLPVWLVRRDCRSRPLHVQAIGRNQVSVRQVSVGSEVVVGQGEHPRGDELGSVALRRLASVSTYTPVLVTSRTRLGFPFAKVENCPLHRATAS
jgi:hypothetical protein